MSACIECIDIIMASLLSRSSGDTTEHHSTQLKEATGEQCFDERKGQCMI